MVIDTIVMFSNFKNNMKKFLLTIAMSLAIAGTVFTSGEASASPLDATSKTITGIYQQNQAGYCQETQSVYEMLRDGVRNYIPNDVYYFIRGGGTCDEL